MRFALDAEQTAFGRSLDRMFAAADTPSAVRAWARGEHGPGRALWRRAADAGVFALAAPGGLGGVGPLPVEVGVAFVEFGRHCVPGPLVETVAVTALLSRLAETGEAAPAKEWVPRVCAGRARLTLAAPARAEHGPRAGRAAAPTGGPYAPAADAVFVATAGAEDAAPEPRPTPGHGPVPRSVDPARPYALDADAADAVFVVTGGEDGAAPELRLAPGHGPVLPSVDPARRLAVPAAGGERLAAGPAVRDAASCARLWAAYATAAQALGVGHALLDRTVAHARRRVQFGTVIGSFQAVKHRLADALIGLEFARPLLYGAAVALAAGSPGARAEVAAAKAAACDAAYAAARTALQVHGAIGYTSAYELSLWLGKARALRQAWGSPADCRRDALELPHELFHQ
ncbi:acyl-CoA dehydrogenase [Streptomyces abikoensis]|uniref:acyl-CoA dehydrogenase n=1 Tax=Streptomyces abikoensis TaxID=97398 RepID=UPI0033C9789C